MLSPKNVCLLKGHFGSNVRNAVEAAVFRSGLCLCFSRALEHVLPLAGGAAFGWNVGKRNGEAN